ncbi:MAG: hypothetical protein FJ100_18860, partial [Deltaproteobacteria bacterium]|nr:hypothetical protein [Deltaproteobacteria bacterium]
KTMLAQNIAHAALLRGRTVRVVDAAAMLDDLQRNADHDQRKRGLEFVRAAQAFDRARDGGNCFDHWGRSRAAGARLRSLVVDRDHLGKFVRRPVLGDSGARQCLSSPTRVLPAPGAPDKKTTRY